MSVSKGYQALEEALVALRAELDVARRERAEAERERKRFEFECDSLLAGYEREKTARAEAERAREEADRQLFEGYEARDRWRERCEASDQKAKAWHKAVEGMSERLAAAESRAEAAEAENEKLREATETAWSFNATVTEHHVPDDKLLSLDLVQRRLRAALARESSPAGEGDN
jgi:chromosome segregation ATPase